AGQHPPKNKRPKEQGENRIKPTNKKAKPKTPKVKDRDSADSTSKSQSIMMQAMDNGRFQKPAAMMSLMAGQTVELRCKGSKVEWSYPTYLDTFKDSRLRASHSTCIPILSTLAYDLKILSPDFVWFFLFKLYSLTRFPCGSVVLPKALAPSLPGSYNTRT
ncbi:hypothetical protein STEG23_020255, partial [Scotinomys teguina]